MQVTFDTQVWNRMVFPERYSDRPNHAVLVKINNAIRCGQVRGFLCESFGTIESIKREDRARFHLQDVPKVQVTHKSHGPGLHCLTIDIQANHSLHPGLTQQFEEELNEALAIGMKLLSAPYIGVAVPDRLRNNPRIYAEEVFATADYNERFGNVASAIAARGVGGGALAALAKELTTRLERTTATRMVGSGVSPSRVRIRAARISVKRRSRLKRHLRNPRTAIWLRRM